MPNRRALLGGLGALGMTGTPARAARLESARYAAVPAAQLDGLVLGPGPAGRCDDNKTAVGVPRFDAASRRWMMWYFCRDEATAPQLPPTLSSGRIALATSADGLSWDRFQGPLTAGAVLEPSADPKAFDCVHVGLTDVTYADGQWWMWYFGGDREEIELAFGKYPGYRMRAGLAVSRDGIAWIKRPGAGPGGALADTEGALYSAWHNALHADGKIYMYTAITDPKLTRWDTLIYVSSDNGAAWSKPTPLKWLDASPGYDGCGELTRNIVPNPLRTGHRWLMAYTALDADRSRWQRRSIALAVSDDALSWRRLYGRPIFEIGPATAWDGGGVAAPQLMKVGNQWRLYYHGFPKPELDASLPKGMGLALSDRAEPLEFQRFPG
jgi:hypothetical protein